MATINQMRDYLKIATAMESDVYTSKKLVNKLSSRINTLNSTNYYTEQNYLMDSIKTTSVENRKSHLSKGVKVFIIMCVISCVIAVLFLSLFVSSKELLKNILLYGVSFGMWAVIIGVIVRIKKKNAKSEANNNQRINEHKLQESKILKQKNDLIIDDYTVQLQEARRQLDVSLNNLNKLYSENLLPASYRNFVAVATMYQWLQYGICTEIYGHGGLFDRYDYELKFNRIIGTLDEINSKLDSVIENQRMLYDEIQRGNQIAEKTYQSVRNIENNTDRMSKDIKQIKINSNITAMNTARTATMNEYMYYRSLYY